MSQQPGTRLPKGGTKPTEGPPLTLLVLPRLDREPGGPGLAATLAAVPHGVPVLVAGATAEPALPQGAAPLRGLPEPGFMAFLQPGDEPDMEAMRAAVGELERDDRADLLLAAVCVGDPGDGIVHGPPPGPLGAEQLLVEGCLAPGSVLVKTTTPGLATALDEFGSGAVAAGMLGLLLGGRPRTSELVLATVVEDPAAGWWTDDAALAAVAQLAGSPLARERGIARPLRRELLSRLLNERPILGQPARLPSLAADEEDPEQLRELIDDLLWTLERQADSLLVLGGGWDDVPISPSPETGELFDLELVRRDDEIRRLRATEGTLRDRLEDLRRRVAELRDAHATDARTIADLRAAAGAGPRDGDAELNSAERRAAGSAAIRAWRRVLPPGVRAFVWRVAPRSSEAIRRRATGGARREAGD